MGEEARKIPESLYRFASFDADKHYEELIRDNRLYFAQPSEFNDPFECKIAPDFTLYTREIWQSVYRKLADEEIALNREPFFGEIINQDIDYMLENPKHHIESFRSMFNLLLGICCFSEKKDNLLMWAHYAKGHRGICLEFNGPMMQSHFLSYQRRIGQTIFLTPVRYEREYPLLSLPLEDLVTWSQTVYTTKSTIWKYEKEWRLIYLYGGKEKPRYNDSILKNIYLGVGCGNTEINIIRELIKNKSPKPKLYKGRMADFQFKIVFDEIPNT